MTSFLRLLHKFSSNISETELVNLMFLCRDKIGKRKLEGVTSGIGLFSILLEQRNISAEQTDFLKLLLNELKRNDLVAELDSFIKNGRNIDGEELDPVQIEQLNAAYEVICENVGKEWKMLIRNLGVPESKIENIICDNPGHTREQFRQCLTVWQRIKHQDAQVDILVQTLRRSKMTLVADKVEERLRNL